MSNKFIQTMREKKVAHGLVMYGTVSAMVFLKKVMDMIREKESIARMILHIINHTIIPEP